jgi:F-type H+-transporting ATPase subunit delta
LIRNAVARRYAQALFELALADGQVEAIGVELEGLVGAVKADPELATLFIGSSVPPRQKQAMVGRALEGRVSPLMAGFVAVAIDRRREGYLEGILEDYRRRADRHRNVFEVVATTAIALSEAEAEELGTKMTGAVGGKVRLVRKVDPALLGGLVLRIGDRLVDGSVRGQLERLKAHLSVAAGPSGAGQ